MPRSSVVIIGAGQAGLAMSCCLSRQGVPHVVLERGRIAERWRSERWDSLRLLTPNWASRLPGWSYRGAEPDGFMTATELAAHLDAYASSFDAPVVEGATVRSVRRGPFGYRVESTAGDWDAGAVVVATGHCDTPLVPNAARDLPASVLQLTPDRYRNPAQLPDGGVLVVGASATGVQLAHEIHRSGRPVTLSVGRHTRLPRRYRGRDIWHWMDRSGLLEDRAAGMLDLARLRRMPSFQLAGRSGGALDLGTLQAAGIRLTGRFRAVAASTLCFDDDLAASVTAAQAALQRLLARLDTVADAAGAPPDPGAAPPIHLPPAPTALELTTEGIRSVIWATGHRRDYGWLHLPVLDAEGEIQHDGGITPLPGLLVIGLRFLRRRSSSFLDGVGRDAEELAPEILAHLSRPGREAA